MKELNLSLQKIFAEYYGRIYAEPDILYGVDDKEKSHNKAVVVLRHEYRKINAKYTDFQKIIEAEGMKLIVLDGFPLNTQETVCHIRKIEKLRFCISLCHKIMPKFASFFVRKLNRVYDIYPSETSVLLGSVDSAITVPFRLRLHYNHCKEADICGYEAMIPDV